MYRYWQALLHYTSNIPYQKQLYVTMPGTLAPLFVSKDRLCKKKEDGFCQRTQFPSYMLSSVI
jgi:hypothetical protein